MSAKTIIPMAVGAVGMALGQEYLAPMFMGEAAGAGAAGAGLGAAANELEMVGPGALLGSNAGIAAHAGNFINESPFLSGIFGGPVTEQGTAKFLGGGIGSLGGSMIGKQLAKGLGAQPVQMGSAGPTSFPNSRGVTPPTYQFQTVGVQPGSIIGAQRGDILDQLRRLTQRV